MMRMMSPRSRSAPRMMRARAQTGMESRSDAGQAVWGGAGREGRDERERGSKPSLIL